MTFNPAKKKVLVVDDEQKLLRVLSIKLKISGFDVITAPDGQLALELIETEQPDIMLMDIIMPVLDGFQVLEKLRTFSDIPVIALSARTENAGKAISLGADCFVSKPFDVDNLISLVEKTLSK
ncbi:MAG: hypothetical protein A2Z29_02190 [Chloroflexi bacterium RBG_16_56_11]|nr:MAG: hypothetical protein A2Z29_02190 [Chloroflexi bacterium RBG_16_56_11]